mmetsp:Transcript_124327/g.310826  ORF Transcript_124327/g.310826 Transcript_124327/m.310826 type:complete len:306 (+) Transcript_124327:5296-6213(+)
MHICRVHTAMRQVLFQRHECGRLSVCCLEQWQLGNLLQVDAALDRQHREVGQKFVPLGAGQSFHVAALVAEQLEHTRVAGDEQRRDDAGDALIGEQLRLQRGHAALLQDAGQASDDVGVLRHHRHRNHGACRVNRHATFTVLALAIAVAHGQNRPLFDHLVPLRLLPCTGPAIELDAVLLRHLCGCALGDRAVGDERPELPEHDVIAGGEAGLRVDALLDFIPEGQQIGEREGPDSWDFDLDLAIDALYSGVHRVGDRLVALLVDEDVRLARQEVPPAIELRVPGAEDRDLVRVRQQQGHLVHVF